MKSYLKKVKREFDHRIKFLLPRSNKNSVYFYTFHKCASTLFSDYILRNLEGLYQIDYASYLWNKPNSYKGSLEFKDRGYIYGPIRLSATNELVYNLLVNPTSSPEFVKDKTAIFFIRDPRDILVSGYYSFGFTHGLNPVKDIRSAQIKLRNEIQSLSIDEYVLKFADEQYRYFNTLLTIADKCEKKIILKYEDMIENFESFINDLKTIVSLNDKVIHNIFKKSRPKKSVDNASHRRSGETKRYIKELKPETIRSLNKRLGIILDEFKYTK